MLFKGKLAYTYWLKLYGLFRKPERFGIGEKIDILFLEVLELLYQARYASVANRMPFLEQSISKIDRIKFFLEITWENLLIKTKNYSELLQKLEEIGRELGGWKKGMINKNSRS